MLLLPSCAIHKAPDAIFEVNNIEVYKQAQGFTTEFQVRKELGLMNGRDSFDRLDLDCHQVFSHQIHAVTKFDDLPVHNWETDLRGDRNPARARLTSCAVNLVTSAVAMVARSLHGKSLSSGLERQRQSSPDLALTCVLPRLYRMALANVSLALTASKACASRRRSAGFSSVPAKS